jgi:RNA polymerase sigma-70 factor (ECF subfamily)
MLRAIEIEHLKLLKEGDLKSFEWVFQHHHSKVYGYCFKLTSSVVVSEELTSDVFVRLWTKRFIIDVSVPIDALLFKISRDLIFNYLKKQSRVSRQLLQYSTIKQQKANRDLENDFILKEYLSIAEDAIRQLPEKRRLVFLLHHQSGLNNMQIAERMNISENTVRVHLFKATQFLREYLKSHPGIIAVFLCLLR